MFILSWCVTFSVQVVILMVMWTLLSLLFRNNYVMYRIQSALVLYGIIICLVFYCIIVPWNGTETTLIDHIIHICIPLPFLVMWYFQNGGRFAKISRLEFMAYPIVYCVFITLVSFRRGYPVYPPGIVGVGIVFLLVHKLSQIKIL